MIVMGKYIIGASKYKSRLCGCMWFLIASEKILMEIIKIIIISFVAFCMI